MKRSITLSFVATTFMMVVIIMASWTSISQGVGDTTTAPGPSSSAAATLCVPLPAVQIDVGHQRFSAILDKGTGVYDGQESIDVHMSAMVAWYIPPKYDSCGHKIKEEEAGTSPIDDVCASTHFFYTTLHYDDMRMDKEIDSDLQDLNIDVPVTEVPNRMFTIPRPNVARAWVECWKVRPHDPPRTLFESPITAATFIVCNNCYFIAEVAHDGHGNFLNPWPGQMLPVSHTTRSMVRDIEPWKTLWDRDDQRHDIIVSRGGTADLNCHELLRQADSKSFPLCVNDALAHDMASNSIVPVESGYRNEVYGLDTSVLGFTSGSATHYSAIPDTTFIASGVNRPMVLSATSSGGGINPSAIIGTTSVDCNCGTVENSFTDVAYIGQNADEAFIAHELGLTKGHLVDEYFYKYKFRDSAPVGANCVKNVDPASNSPAVNEPTPTPVPLNCAQDVPQAPLGPNCFTTQNACVGSLTGGAGANECLLGCRTEDTWRSSTASIMQLNSKDSYGPLDTCVLSNVTLEVIGHGKNVNFGQCSSVTPKPTPSPVSTSTPSWYGWGL